MEGRLGVKIAALSGESVLLVDVITDVLQYLAQVLTTRDGCCTLFSALRCITHTDTHTII